MMRSVSRQAMAKSIRPRLCNRQVEHKPTASNTFMRRVTYSDRGLATLGAIVSGVFQSTLAIHKIDAENDSICTGRSIKNSSGASVPAALKSRETPFTRRQIPTKTPIGRHLPHAYHFP